MGVNISTMIDEIDEISKQELEYQRVFKGAKMVIFDMASELS